MRPAASREREVLQAEIGETRAALGRTVQELAARADVASRLRASRSRAMTTATQLAGRARGAAEGAGRSSAGWFVLAGGAAALLVMLMMRGRRPRTRRRRRR
jgi:hypothetical protein